MRKAAGLTQVQLSQKAKVSRFRLSMAESDFLELRVDEIEAINLSDHIKSGQRLSLQNRPTEVAVRD
jgi:DNA-binding XRE family transcriptional regulator